MKISKLRPVGAPAKTLLYLEDLRFMLLIQMCYEVISRCDGRRTFTEDATRYAMVFQETILVRLSLFQKFVILQHCLHEREVLQIERNTKNPGMSPF
jgi:hypothetical protein